MNTRFFTLALLTSLTVAGCASSQNRMQASSSGSETDIISVRQGLLSGSVSADGSVEIFAGIPYAAPPVGDLRWKEPQDPENWQGVLKATEFAPIAWQHRDGKFVRWVYRNFIYHDRDGDRQDYAPMSEDCLYLNIWRPSGTAQDANLPVLFYIHGGSLMSGSSIYESYDGSSFARNGVIMVTVAYRLGVMGYLALDELSQESPNRTTGNYGLLDQIKALEWVHENIAAFGGDSGNITIAGESAGATSVSALCSSPLAKGLFRRAIAESSGILVRRPPHTYRTLEQAKDVGEAIKKEFKASTLADLRAIPAERLVTTSYRNDGVTIDGYALTEPPYETYARGENNEESVLGGFNAREGYFFNFFNPAKKKDYEERVRSYFGKYTDDVLALYPAGSNSQARDNWNTICGIVWFANTHHVWSEVLSAQGKDAWEYYFTKENGGIGTNHSGEIIYAYGNVPETKYYTRQDHDLEGMMMSYWINFARTGNPNGVNLVTGETLPEWRTYSESPGQVMELGPTVGMRTDPYLEMYDIVLKVMEE